MRNLRLLLPALALACAVPAGAVPAKRGFHTLTQPDGTRITVQLVGDERSHFLLSEDGALLTESEGAYYFGRLQNDGSVVSTNILAADPQFRSQIQANAIEKLSDARMIEASRIRTTAKPRFYDFDAPRMAAPASAASESTLPQFGLGRTKSSFPNKGEVRALVILVEYKDVKFTVDDPTGYFTDMLNKDGFDRQGGTGCAAEYFRFQSDNQFIPQFDVYGPVQLKYNRSYYGANTSWGEDSAAEEMVIESVKALDKDVDFSVYDMDKDGVLDNVFIFYAGVGEASSGLAIAVWPHSFALEYSRKEFKVDGVTVNHYGCTNELYGDKPDGVGTFIHEFSHVIGLPDLYDTSGAGLTCTPDFWNVLDYGPYNNNGRTPPNYSMFERNAMQWVEPTLITESETITLRNLADSNDNIMIQTNKPTEFFLFENRQQKGWDEYLPGHGMLIWHIDYNENTFELNQVNNISTHQRVHLKKANNVHSATRGDEKILAGWSWPGTSGATEFTADTKPAFEFWTGHSSSLPITEIKEKDGLITFKVDGGGSPIPRPVAIEPAEDEVGTTWFIAKWEAVDEANDYLLTVMERDPGEVMEEHVCDMGSGTTFMLPDEWTSSSNAVYTSNGNIGENSPSLKLNSNGAWLKTPEFNANISGVTLWLKGQQNEGSYVEITGTKSDGSNVEVAKIEPLRNEGKVFQISEIPSGVRQLTFTWVKDKGNIAVDDVVVNVGGTTIAVVEGYDGVSTNGQTSVRVENLNNSKVYSFYVEGTDGQYNSKKSNAVEVSLKEITGVSEVSAATLILAGRTVSAPVEFGVYDLSGSVLAASTKSHTFTTPGLYLVRLGSEAVKLLVK